MVGVPAGSAHEFVLLLGDLWFQFWSLIQLDSIIFGKRAGWLTCVQQLQKKKVHPFWHYTQSTCCLVLGNSWGFYLTDVFRGSGRLLASSTLNTRTGGAKWSAAVQTSLCSNYCQRFSENLQG